MRGFFFLVEVRVGLREILRNRKFLVISNNMKLLLLLGYKAIWGEMEFRERWY